MIGLSNSLPAPMATAMTLVPVLMNSPKLFPCLSPWPLPSILSMAKTKSCVVTRFISFFLWAPRWIIFITLGSYPEPTQLGSDQWIMERHHARHLQCEWPVKILHLLPVTPLPLHSDHILMLKIGPQSGRVQALELTFGQKNKKQKRYSLTWLWREKNWIFIGLFHWSLRGACNNS